VQCQWTVNLQSIIRSYREACRIAVEELRKQSVSLADRGDEEKRNLLRKCAETSMNSKLIACEKDFFSEMVVDAVSCLDTAILDPTMIGIKKVTGAGLRDSYLCKGVAFKKTFSYAGFEQQPKSFQNPRILLLNIELELKAERENAEVRLSDPTQYQSIVDAEWSIIYEKLANCHKSGAQIVLSRLAIGDLATQYFADRGIFCAGRVTEEDMQRVAKATGARTQTTVNKLDPAGALLATLCDKLCIALNSKGLKVPWNICLKGFSMTWHDRNMMISLLLWLHHLQELIASRKSKVSRFVHCFEVKSSSFVCSLANQRFGGLFVIVSDHITPGNL
jgi:chaperonin GroEL (HSP60 family)